MPAQTRVIHYYVCLGAAGGKECVVTMQKLTFWKKIGLSFIVLMTILVLVNHKLNKDTNTPDRLSLSNLFTVDVNKSHVPWITTADNNKQEALDVVNRKMASTIKNFISKEEKNGSYYSIDHKVIYNTDQLFTLKLELHKTQADSYTKNVYYTINKSTGKSIPLSAYFKDSDYKDVISKEIIRQMKAEMKKDTNKVYWCHKNDSPRFQTISKNQSYYINKKGELVICFDQFEVAPGYMGNPTFTIKNDLLDDYFK